MPNEPSTWSWPSEGRASGVGAVVGVAHPATTITNSPIAGHGTTSNDGARDQKP